ncbi:MAG: hypothetical protein ACREJO_04530 [Phycisphaerales bacterium]
MAEPVRGRELAGIALGAYLLNPVWAEMFFAPIGVVDVILLFRGGWFATGWTTAASVGSVAALACAIGALGARRAGWVRAWMWGLALVVSVHCWGMQSVCSVKAARRTAYSTRWPRSWRLQRR